MRGFKIHGSVLPRHVCDILPLAKFADERSHIMTGRILPTPPDASRAFRERIDALERRSSDPDCPDGSCALRWLLDGIISVCSASMKQSQKTII